MPAFNLETFCRTIQDHKITFVYVAPPVIVHLARSALVEKFDLNSLRMITSGAAPLTQELVDSVYARLKLKINQAYGLSETSPMTHTQVPESTAVSSSSTKIVANRCVLAMGRMVFFSRISRQNVSKHDREIHVPGRQRARTWRSRRVMAERPQRVQRVLEAARRNKRGYKRRWVL